MDDEKIEKIVIEYKQPSPKDQLIGSAIAVGATILAPVVVAGLIYAGKGIAVGASKIIAKIKSKKNSIKE